MKSLQIFLIDNSLCLAVHVLVTNTEARYFYFNKQNLFYLFSYLSFYQFPNRNLQLNRNMILTYDQLRNVDIDQYLDGQLFASIRYWHLGSAGGAIDNDSELDFGEPSSNFSRICHIRLRANIPCEKYESITSCPAMG